MSVSWVAADGRSFYATVVTFRPFVTLRLVIEKLPASNCWDWVVWQCGAPEITPKNGKERSPVSARIACENAAKTWIVNSHQPRC